MTHDPTTPDARQPWLYRFAVLLTVATFPLIASGGTVTSTGVGMVDPTWTFNPFNMLTPQGFTATAANGIGWVIEHGHRQIGYIVGMMAIVLTVWTMITQPTVARKLLGFWILLAVGTQGILGAVRIWSHTKPGVVSMDLGRDVAMLHGVTGQLVLCLMAITVAILGTRNTAEGIETPAANKLRRITLLTSLLMVVQLVVGVLLRHLGGMTYLWVHLLLGTGVAVHVILVLVRSRQQPAPSLRSAASLMMVLLVLQVLLGVGAWWFDGGTGLVYLVDKLTNARIVLTTAHQFLGALLLMTSAVTTFRAYRHLRQAPQPQAGMMPLHAAGVGA